MIFPTEWTNKTCSSHHQPVIIIITFNQPKYYYVLSYIIYQISISYIIYHISISHLGFFSIYDINISQGSAFPSGNLLYILDIQPRFPRISHGPPWPSRGTGWSRDLNCSVLREHVAASMFRGLPFRDDSGWVSMCLYDI